MHRNIAQISKKELDSYSSDHKLKFDQAYCIKKWLTSDVLLVSKILLGYEEALWLKKLEISYVSQIVVLS